MAVKAYVLIDAAPGKVGSIVKALSGVPGVTGVDAVTGPHDAIVTLESNNLNNLGKLVTDKVQSLDGVMRTTTCVAVTV